AIAVELRRNPELNATWEDGEPRRREDVAVAVAVDTERGLLAPVLSDPDLLERAELAERIRDVTGRAQTGRLEFRELAASASSTMSHFGRNRVGGCPALLTPPQPT